MNRQVERRTFLKGAAAAAAAAAVASPSVVRAAGPLVINSYGGSFEKFMREHIVAPFEEETGIETTLDINLGKGWLANLRAAGPENPPYDVLMTNEAWASIEREEGFFEQIPVSEVPNMRDVYPSMRLFDDMAVIGTLAPIGLCYRHDMVETVPTSWMDLWNVEEYQGRTGMYTITNSAGYMFVLLTAKMYHGSEYEVDKALDTIKELLPFNQVDFSGTMETVLTQGEAVIAPIDFPAGTRIRKKGVEVSMSAPKEGMFMFDQVFNVLKGSRNKENGYKWIDYILRPDVQRKWVEHYYWTPVNSLVELSEQEMMDVPVHGDRINEIVLFDWASANKVRDHVIERWNKEMRN